MMLLERDPVLASLRQYAHEAGQGEGRLVLIGGEAGIGKAEGAGDEEAVVRHASLAARRAVDLGSHREAAAQYERALRWAAQAAPPALAEL
jgi:hypothetical protein